MLNVKHGCKLCALSFIFLFCFISSNVVAHGQLEITIPPVDVTSFPPISEDVDALANYSGYARVASQRLIERGVEVLTQAHGVLEDANSSFIQRMQLITVLGEIADESSVAVIIDAAEQNVNNRYLYQNVLLALNNFSQTKEIKGFVNRQLQSKQRDPIIQRTALAYYAKQPAKDAEQWVDLYASLSASVDVRYAALYLGGVLGREDVKPAIEELLKKNQIIDREYYLLLGFANVATMEEFNALVKDKNLNLDNVNKVRDFLKFRLANAEEKKNLAEEYLNTNNSQLKQAVVKHLIKEKDADALASNWQQGDGAVRAAIKRAGFTINVDEHGTELVKTPNNKVFPLWLYLLVFAAIAAFAFLILRKKMNNT